VYFLYKFHGTNTSYYEKFLSSYSKAQTYNKILPSSFKTLIISLIAYNFIIKSYIKFLLINIFIYDLLKFFNFKCLNDAKLLLIKRNLHFQINIYVTIKKFMIII
jgi:hypothetical protein